MDRLKGKKILILGGANQHLKFVEAAKELGVYSIVTDNLPNSPCKKVCNESWMLNITDIDRIVEACKENHIDGVIAGFLDPCQIPYSKICEQLSLPCYGTTEQFFKFSNKIAFKELCRKNGVGVIPDYTEKDYLNGTIDYPVFVKPVDSRGSRGQTICNSSSEMPSAIQFAKEQSVSGDIIIEKFMGDCDEVQITNFVINGKVFLERTVDSYRSNVNPKLQKVVCCSISPSKYTDIYIQNCHSSVCRMIRDLGIMNGPIFMQGFYKEGLFYFFDPGLRFPGVEFERIYKKIWNIDFAQLLIYYSLTGYFPKGTTLPTDAARLNGNVAAILFPLLNHGTIKTVSGLDSFCNNPNVISCLTRYNEGDCLGMTYDVNQRFAEIDFLANDFDELAHLINSFYDNVRIKDLNEKDMLLDRFDTNRFCFQL